MLSASRSSARSAGRMRRLMPQLALPDRYDEPLVTRERRGTIICRFGDHVNRLTRRCVHRDCEAGARAVGAIEVDDTGVAIRFGPTPPAHADVVSVRVARLDAQSYNATRPCRDESRPPNVEPRIVIRAYERRRGRPYEPRCELTLSHR